MGQNKNSLGFSTKVLLSRVFQLMKQPIFIILTTIGSTWIFFGAYIFLVYEGPNNVMLNSYLDAVYWSISTMTTVGYGDIVPVTDTGKVISIFIMVGGTILFWCYTGLFASAIIAPELRQVESEVEGLEESVKKIQPPQA